MQSVVLSLVLMKVMAPPLSASFTSLQVGVMRRMTIVVAMIARCLVDSIHVLTKDSAVTGAQLCQNIYCLPWQCLFGCGNGRRSAIKQFG